MEHCDDAGRVNDIYVRMIKVEDNRMFVCSSKGTTNVINSTLKAHARAMIQKSDTLMPFNGFRRNFSSSKQ